MNTFLPFTVLCPIYPPISPCLHSPITKYQLFHFIHFLPSTFLLLAHTINPSIYVCNFATLKFVYCFLYLISMNSFLHIGIFSTCFYTRARHYCFHFCSGIHSLTTYMNSSSLWLTLLLSLNLKQVLIFVERLISSNFLLTFLFQDLYSFPSHSV